MANVKIEQNLKKKKKKKMKYDGKIIKRNFIHQTYYINNLIDQEHSIDSQSRANLT